MAHAGRFRMDGQVAVVTGADEKTTRNLVDTTDEIFRSQLEQLHLVAGGRTHGSDQYGQDGHYQYGQDGHE